MAPIVWRGTARPRRCRWNVSGQRFVIDAWSAPVERPARPPADTDPEARVEIVEGWAREFAPYRARAEKDGNDLWVDLLARLARVGVTPSIVRADIQQRRALGWTLDELGPVLDALAMETHRSAGKPEMSASAVYARTLFDAMADRAPCPLAELARQVPS